MTQFLFVLFATAACTLLAVGLMQIFEKESVASMRLRKLDAAAGKGRNFVSQLEAGGNRRFLPNHRVRAVVIKLQLARYFGAPDARERLVQAGFRSPSHEVSYLFARFVCPIAFASFGLFEIFVMGAFEGDAFSQAGMVGILTIAGLRLPNTFLKATITKRRESIRLAWPDALDLLNICIRSGVAMEQSIRLVSGKMAHQSYPLAEELRILLTELSYLPSRRQALENLANRVDILPVRNFATAMIQQETSGLEINKTLQILATEGRDERASTAERKAASLPSLMTVPMMIGLMPLLIIVMLGPPAIRYFMGN